MNDKLKRILILIFGLAALTVIFRVNGLDMKIESFFYDRAASKWIFENNPLVEFSYKFGTVLPFLLGAFAVIALGMSFMNSGFSRYRKASLLFILTFLIGPGLFVNVIFKNYSGRPRPREVKEFGGRWDYREAFDFGTPGKGHSFPCGHASAGFMLIALYYSLRHKNQSQARAAMGIGLTYGGLMGVGRMLQGAHFASDVVWAAGIVALTAEVLDNYVIKTDGLYVDQKINKSGSLVGLFIIVPLVTAAAAFFALSTPFYREKSYDTPLKAASVKINVQDSNVNIGVSENGKLIIRARTNGFCFKGSDYFESFNADDGKGIVSFNAVKKGFFTELVSDVTVLLPAGTSSVLVNSGRGDIVFKCQGTFPDVVLYSADGDINFNAAENSVFNSLYLKTRKGDINFYLDRGSKFTGVPVAYVSAVNGKIYVRNESEYFGALAADAEKKEGAKELFLFGKAGERMSFESGLGMHFEGANVHGKN